MKKTLAILLLLLLVSGALAQTGTSFVQSRFFGTPSSDSVRSESCSTCLPSVDGILEYRLGEPRKENTTATFTVQMRVDGGDSEVTNRTRLTMASVRLAYNEVVFGERVVENGKCSASLAGEFSGKGYQEIFGDTFDNTFTFTATTTTQIVATMDSDLLRPRALVQLTDQFEDFVTIECSFGSSTSGDLGVAVSGTDISSNMIYIYDDLDSPRLVGGMNRNIFPLVRNDLRSVRVENNSIYATDYILFREGDGNGSGVRVTFSGAITRQLVPADFVLDPPQNPSIMITVEHIINANTATITFNSIPPSETVLEFAADPTNTALAAGGHIAELRYVTDEREAPPLATGASLVSRIGILATWSITFDKALDANSVKADSLCLTQTPGDCPDPPLTSSIIDAMIDPTDDTKIRIVVREDRSQAADLTVAFKRNRVRGANSNPVAQDQQALVRQVGVPLNNPPVVTISSPTITILDAGTRSEGSVIVTVTDADVANEITITLAVVDADSAPVEIRGDGIVTIESNVARQPQTFTLEAKEKGTTGTATVTVTVSDGTDTVINNIELKVEENVAPEITGLTAQTITVGGTEAVEFNVTDPNANLGDTITDVTVLSSDSNTLRVVGNAIEEPGSGNYSVNITGVAAGITMLTVTATDSANNTTAQTVNVSVTEVMVNTAPTLYNLTPRDISIRAGSTGTTSIFVTDAEGGNIAATAEELTEELGEPSQRLLRITPSDQSQSLALSGGQHQFQWVIRADSNVASTMTRVVEMTATVEGLSVTSRTRVTILPNAAPTIMELDTARRIRLNEEMRLDFTVEDPDGREQDLRSSVSVTDRDILSASLTNTNGSFVLTMTGREAGQTTVTVTVRDEINEISHVIRVTVNEAPQIILPDLLTLLDAGSGTIGSVQVYVSDDVAGTVTIGMRKQVDGDPLTITPPTDPTVTITESGTAVLSNAFTIQVSEEVEVDENTTVTVIITATDTEDGIATTSIEVVIRLNVAPVISEIPAQSVQVNATKMVNFMVMDDNAGLGDFITTVTVVETMSNGTTRSKVVTDNEDGSYHVTIGGTDVVEMTTLTVTAIDSAGNMGTRIVTVNVVAEPEMNKAPQITQVMPKSLTLLNTAPRNKATIQVYVSDDAVGDVFITMPDSGSVDVTTNTERVRIEDPTIEVVATFELQATAGITADENILNITPRDGVLEGETTSIRVVTEVNRDPEIRGSSGETTIPGQTVQVDSVDIMRFRVTDPNTVNEPITVTVRIQNGADFISLDESPVMNLGDGNYSVQITGVAAGDATLIVSARDSRTFENLGLVTQEVTVRVNSPPQIDSVTPLSGSFLAGSEEPYTVAIADSNGDELTVTLKELNTNILELSTTSVRVMPENLGDFRFYNPVPFTIRSKNNVVINTNVEIEITVTDGAGGSAIVTRQLTITPNSSPVIALNTTTQTLVEGEEINLNFMVTDSDSSDSNVSVELDEDILDEDILDAVVIADLGANFTLRIEGEMAGQTTVTVVVSDEVNTVRHEIVVTVTEVPNKLPTIASGVPEMISLLDAGRGSSVAVTVTVTDEDVGDDITILLTVPDDAPVAIVGESMAIIVGGTSEMREAESFTLEAKEKGTTGTTIVTVSVTDGEATTKSEIVVTVSENAAPVITSIDPIDNFMVGTSEQVDFTITDADGDITTKSVTVSVEENENIITSAEISEIEATDNTLRGKITITAGAAAGNTTLTMTITDSAQNEATQKVPVMVVVTRMNEAPEITQVTPSPLRLLDTEPNNSRTVQVFVSDDVVGTVTLMMEEQGDGNRLRIIPPTPPTVTIVRADTAVQSGDFTIQVLNVVAEKTTVMVTITATDDAVDAGVTTSTLEVVIVPNAAPTIAEIANQTINVDQTKTVEFMVTDPNTGLGDITTVTVVSGDSNTLSVGNIRFSGSEYSVQITGVAAGDTMLTVTATDSAGTTGTQTVNVNVNAPPEFSETNPPPRSLTIIAGQVNGTGSFGVSDTEPGLVSLTVKEQGTNLLNLPTTQTLEFLSFSLAFNTNFDILVPKNVDSTTDAEVEIKLVDAQGAQVTSRLIVTINPNNAPEILTLGLEMLDDTLTVASSTKTELTFIFRDLNFNPDEITLDNVSVKLDSADDIVTTATITNTRVESNLIGGRTKPFLLTITAGEMAGQATVTVVANDEVNTVRHPIRVTVNANPDIRLSASDISLLDAGRGSSATVTVTVTDEDAADDIMIELTVDEDAPVEIVRPRTATIEGGTLEMREAETFTIQAIAAGTAIVTVAVTDGTTTVKDSIEVTVTKNTSPTISIAASIDNLQIETELLVGFTVIDANGDISTSSIVVEAEDNNIITTIGDVVEVADRENNYRVPITAGATGGITALTVTVTDSAGNKDTRVVSVTVVETDVNKAPQITQVVPPSLILLDTGPRNTEEVEVYVQDDKPGTVTISMAEVGDENRLTIAAAQTVTIRAFGEEQSSDFEITVNDDAGITEMTTATVLITATDGDASMTTNIEVVIVPNAAPAITELDQMRTIALNNPERINFTVTDTNTDLGDTVTVSTTVTDSAILTVGEVITGSNNSYSIVIQGIKAGMTDLTVSATDGATTTTSVMQVTVNANPTIELLGLSDGKISLLDAGITSTTVMVTVTDADVADEITISLTVDQDAPVAIVRPSTATVLGSTREQRAAESFKIIATEDGDTTVTVTVADGTVTVKDIIVVSITENTAPMITGLVDQRVGLNTEKTISFTVTDEAIDIVAVSTTVTDSMILSIVGEVSADANNSYSVTIRGEMSGQTTLTVTATDSASNSITQSIQVNIRENVVPQITEFGGDTELGRLTLLDASMSPRNTGEVTVFVLDDIAGEVAIEMEEQGDGNRLIIAPTTSAVTILASEEAVESNAFTIKARGVNENIDVAVHVTATDDDGGETTETLVVRIEANVAPVIAMVAEQQIATVGGSKTVEFMVTDANRNLLSNRTVVSENMGIDIITIAAVMPVAGKDDTYSVVIEGFKAGMTTMTITAVDDGGAEATPREVRVRVNTAPQIVAVSPMMISLLDDGTSSTASLMVTVADADAADELTISLSSSLLESIGDAIIAGKTMRLPQSFTLRAKENSTGTEAVMVIVSDGATTAEQRIELTVTENVAPAIELAAMATIETNTATTVSFIVMDTNIGLGDTVRVTADETGVEADDEILTIEEVVADEGQDNSYSVKILSEVAGQTTLTVTARDSANNEVTQSIRLTVNTTPEIELSDAEISLLDEGTPSEAVVMVTVTDADAADEITIELTVDASAPVEIVGVSTATIESNAVRSPRAFRLRAIEGTTGTATVTVSASDGKVTAEERITVTVDENTSPTISIAASIDDLQIQTQRQIGFTVIDANGDISTSSISVVAEDPDIATVIGNVEEDDGENRYRVSIMAGTMTGNTTLTVTVTDTANNEVEQSIRLTVVEGRVNATPQITLSTMMISLPNAGITSTTRVGVTVTDTDTTDEITISLTVDADAEIVEIDPAERVITGGTSAMRAAQTFTIMAIEGMTGNTTVTVTVTDGAATDEESITVEVTENVGPMIDELAQMQMIEANTTRTVNFTVTDADAGDTVTVTAAETGGASILNRGLVMLGVGNSYSVDILGMIAGQTTLTVTATDSANNEVEQSIRLTVVEGRVNATPQITLSTMMISLPNAGITSTTRVGVTVTDTDTTDEITISLTVDADAEIVEIDPAERVITGGTSAMRAAQTFTIMAIEGMTGNTTVTVTVTDGAATDEESITVEVTENVGPMIDELAQMQMIEANTTRTVNFTVTDADAGDTVTVTAAETGGASILNRGLVMLGVGNSYSVDILGMIAGQTTLTVTATDSANNEVEQSIRLTVVEGRVNATPQITLSTMMISLPNAGITSTTRVGVTVTDTDTTDEITISLTVDADAEIVEIDPAERVITGGTSAMRAAQTFTIMAIEGMTGNTTVTVTVTDGAATDEESITVEVTENVGPMIDELAQMQMIEANTTRTVNFTVTDADAGDTVTVTAAETGGASILNRGLVMLGVGNSYSVDILGMIAGQTTLTVTATDSANNEVEQSIRLTVVEGRVNATPQITLSTMMISLPNAGITSTTRVGVTVTDTDTTDEITISLTVDADAEIVEIDPAERVITGGTSAMRAAQTFTIMAIEGMTGNTTVTVTVTDGAATDEESITVEVTENVGPMIDELAQMQMIEANTTRTVNFTVTDADAGDTVTVTAAETGGASILNRGLVMLGVGNSYSVDILGMIAGQTTLTVTATDSANNEVEQSIRLTVVEGRVNATPQITLSTMMISLPNAGITSTTRVGVTVTDTDTTDEITISLTVDADAEIVEIDPAERVITGGTSAMRAAQTFTIMAIEGMTGNTTVTVTVTDGAATDEESITVEVTENVGPMIDELAQMQMIEANTTRTVNFTVTDADAGDTVTVTAAETGGASILNRGLVMLGVGNSYSVDILGMIAGQTTLTVTATDSANNEVEQSIRLTVVEGRVNATPQITLSTMMISLPNAGITSTTRVGVTVTDTDTTDEITISLTVDADAEIVEIDPAERVITGGTSAMRAAQTFTIMAIEGMTGNTTVTVTVTDGAATDEESITVEVTENVGPMIDELAQMQMIEANTTRTVNFTVTDADAGDTVTVTAAETGGASILNRGLVMLGVGNSYSVDILGMIAGQTTLTVTATDSANNEVEQSIRLTVVEGRVNATPQITLSTMMISLPNAGITSTTRVGVTVTDTDTTDEITISLTVDADAEIVEIDPAERVITGGTSAMRAAQTFTIMAIEGMTGNTTVTVTVTDGAATDEESITVEVTENVGPMIDELAQMQMIEANTTRTVNFTVTDADAGDTVTVTAAETGGASILNRGLVMLGVGNSYSVDILGMIAGQTTLTVTATDSANNEVEQSIRLTVVEGRVNATPQITLSTMMISLPNAGITSTTRVGVTVTDTDTTDEITISLTVDADAEIVEIDPAERVITGGTSAMRAAQTFTIMAIEGMTGNTTVTVTVTDGAATDEESITVEVTENVGPMIDELAQMQMIEANTTRTVNFTVTDADAGDTVTVTAAETGGASILNRGLVMLGVGNSYSVDILGMIAGQTTLTVTATDSANNEVEQSIRLTVVEGRVNATPQITLSTMMISLPNAGITSTTRVGVTVTDTDTTDEITISLTVDADAEIVEIDPAERVITGGTSAMRAAQTFTIMAIEGMTGNTTVTVTVTDGAATDEESITVEVTENVGPMIDELAQMQMIEANTTRTVNFTVTDADAGDTVTVTAAETGGASILNRGLVMLGVGNSYSVDILGMIAGQTTLTVTATDSANNEVEQSIRLTVVEGRVNATPQITLSTMMISLPNAGITSTTRVGVTVTDTDTTDEITISLTVDADAEIVEIDPAERVITGGTSAMRAAQTFTIMAIEGMTGNTTVTVTVTDGAATDEESITVEVTENVGPMIDELAQMQMIEANTTRTVNFTVTDADAGDTVTVTAAETGGASILNRGLVMLGVGNSYSVDILGMIAGQTTLTVTATDSANNEVEQSIRVTVNTAPQITTLSDDEISLLDEGTPSEMPVMVTVSDAEATDEITISLTVDADAEIVEIDPAERVITGGTSAMRAAQTFTIKAIEGMTGNTTVTVTVTDGAATDEESITVEVTENVAPVIEGLVNQTIEPNTTETVSFTVMDTNAALGDIVTLTAAETGGASILNIGTVMPGSVDILGKVAGQTTLTVTARDSAMNSDTQSIRLTVNTTPEIELSDAEISLLDEGTPSEAEVMVMVTDADAADEITIELTVDASAPVEIVGVSTATIESNAARSPQAFTLRAIEGTTGTAIVTVSASDGKVTAEERITVTVMENTSPTISIAASIDNLQIQTQRQVGFTVIDANGDISTSSIVVEVEDRNIITDIGDVEKISDAADADNSYRVAITAGTRVGITTLTVTVRDTAGNRDTKKVRVTVVLIRMNENPQITGVSPESLRLLDAGPSNTDEVRVYVSDDINNEVTIEMEAQTANLLRIIPTTNTVTIQALGEPQSDAFRLVAEDVGESTTVMVTITATDSDAGFATTNIEVVIEANVAPGIDMVAEQVVPVSETKTVEFTVMDDNGNIDASGIRVEETAAGTDLIDIIGVVESVQGEVDTYSIEIEGKTAGMTTMTITAMDDGGAEATPREVRVRVNTPPQIVAVSPDMIPLLDAGTPSEAMVMVTVSDADAADEITIELTVDPDASVEIAGASTATIASNTAREAQSFTLRARENTTGTAIVTVRVSDGAATDEESITVEVTENVAPAITGLVNQTIGPNTTETVSFTVMDTNAALGDIVTVTAAETGGASILNIGTVMPGSVDILGKVTGQTTLTVTAKDSANNEVEQSIRVRVNTAPQITTLLDDEISLLDDGTPSEMPVMVTVSDAEATDEITISLTVDADAEIVEIDPAERVITGGTEAMRATQTFTIMAIEGMTGNTTVTVTVTDGAATDEESITVEVTENVAPAITGLVNQTIEPNTTETVSFTVTDMNADIVTVTAAETGGASILNIGTVMPGSVDILGKVTGQTTLTVTATDSANNEVEQSIRVTVNTAPQITTLSDNEISLLDEGTPSEMPVMVTVSDAEATDEITISLTVDADAEIVEIDPAERVITGGTSAIRAAQTFTITAIEGMTGNTTVTVTVTDGAATDEESITVEVTENVAPVIERLVNQTIEPNTTETVSFTVTDMNADIVTVTAAETGGASILNIGTVMPGGVDILGKVAGQTTLTVTATDSAGNEDTQEARVTIESTGIRIRARIFLEGPLR